MLAIPILLANEASRLFQTLARAGEDHWAHTFTRRGPVQGGVLLGMRSGLKGACMTHMEHDHHVVLADVHIFASLTSACQAGPEKTDHSQCLQPHQKWPPETTQWCSPESWLRPNKVFEKGLTASDSSRTYPSMTPALRERLATWIRHGGEKQTRAASHVHPTPAETQMIFVTAI